MHILTFKASNTTSMQNKDYAVPKILTATGLGLVTGYGISKFGKENNLAETLIKYESETAKMMMVREKNNYLNDMLYKFFSSLKYDNITNTKEMVEKFNNKTLKLEDFVDAEDMKVVSEECLNIENKIKNKSKQFSDNMKQDLSKTKKQYLFAGLVTGFIVSAAIFIEKFVNKNREEKDKKNSLFLIAPFTIIGALGGLLASKYFNKSSLEDFDKALEETNLKKRIKLLEIKGDLERKEFDSKLAQIRKNLEEYKDVDEKRYNRWLEKLKDYEEKFNAYIDKKITREEFFGENVIERIDKEIAKAKEDLRMEDIDEASKIYKKFAKNNKKIIGIGAGVGLALGGLVCLIKNARSNK